MATSEEILAIAQDRTNPHTGGKGWLTREDVRLFLIGLGDLAEPQRKETFVDWINSVQFVTQEERNQVINDYQSY